MKIVNFFIYKHKNIHSIPKLACFQTIATVYLTFIGFCIKTTNIKVNLLFIKLHSYLK